MSSRRIHLHRVLKTTPDKVYRAFLESGALAKWLPPYGFTCTVHHLVCCVHDGLSVKAALPAIRGG